MDKKTVILNSKAFAYYFLQHYYRRNLKTDYDETDLKKFVIYFCRFAEIKNKLLVDENGKAILNSTDHLNFANTIMSNYSFDVEKNGKPFCKSFRTDLLTDIREEYLASSNDFKDLVSDYESAYIEEIYNNTKMLLEVECICAKNSNANLKFMQDMIKDKGFDA